MEEAHQPTVGVTVVPPDVSGYVSRAELQAHLDPIRSDVAETKTDVKKLLSHFDQARGAAKAHNIVRDNMWRGFGIAATLCCGLLTGLLVH